MTRSTHCWSIGDLERSWACWMFKIAFEDMSPPLARRRRFRRVCSGRDGFCTHSAPHLGVSLSQKVKTVESFNNVEGSVVGLSLRVRMFSTSPTSTMRHSLVRMRHDQKARDVAATSSHFSPLHGAGQATTIAWFQTPHSTRLDKRVNMSPFPKSTFPNFGNHERLALSGSHL